MLKKVRAIGFKAFADEVEIEFSKGVTGIIGPNGAGKSNIFDAIRWVLGETSAKSLRGGSMRDIIFSGCATRKASDFAEVEIEFDNTNRILPKINDDAVFVSRKAYSNGKSEYFINKQLARLKDVQELFLDTGLGSSSYSMIGQEQTKKLLSEKADERRAIFEEAAGIVKMKNEKVTAEKRLNEVEQDFVRLKDILKELEKQVKPLQKQSEKATQYLSVKKILDKTESNFLVYKYQYIYSELSGFKNELTTHTRNLDEINERIKELDESIKTTKTNLKKTNDELLEHQESKSEQKSNLDSFMNEIKIHEERITSSRTELEEVLNEISEIEKKFSVSVDEFNNKKDRFLEIENVIKHNNLESDTLVQEVFSLEMDINSYKDESDKLREQIALLYNEFQESRLRFEQHTRDEEKALKQLDEIKNAKTEVEEQHINAQSELNNANSKFDDNTKVIEKLADELKTITDLSKNNESTLQKLNSTIIQTETTLAKEEATLSSMETSLENLDGYFEGVKNVIRNKNKINGILDLVSNLFEVKDGYEIALDTMLNSVSQYVVFDTIDNAKNAVNFLKKNRLGRATFIPLEDVNPKKFSSIELNSISSTEGIKCSLEVISHKTELAPLFEHLIGRTLVADNMDIAVQFYKKTGIKTKIVTLDGDTMQPGVISGGTKNNRKGLITKKKEMDTLRESISKNKNKLKTLLNEKEELSASVSANESKKQEIVFSLEERKEIHNELRLLVEESRRNLELITDEIKNNEVTVKEIRFQYEESKRTSASLFKKYQTKELEHTDKTKLLSNTLEKLKSAEAILQEKKEKQTNLLIETEKLEEEKRNLTEFISEQEDGKEDFEQRLEHLQTKKISNESKIYDSTKQIEDITGEYEELLKDYALLDELIHSNKEMKTKLQQQNDELDEELSIKRESSNVLTKQVHELTLKTNSLNKDKEQILKRAFDTYQMDELFILEATPEELDEKKAEQSITELKKQIKQIGSVNLEAIEDYKHLNERYQKDKTQFEDVQTAKRDLEGLLKDISKEMTERFTATFKSVTEHFEDTFVELFGGGQATLKLEDPRHPLTSNIVISVQPPGKKPKRIEMLSGGEKNLTSCALIFAIIKAKPSPFVYLDEIDAPLDDANVSRFAFYLKKFSDNTQFIVVTHRNGTKMAADTLFGVTQEIQGITSVFPYFLDQSNKVPLNIEGEVSNG